MPSSYPIPAAAQPAPPAKAAAAEAQAAPFGRIKFAIALSIFLQRIGINAAMGGKLYPFPLSIFFMPIMTAWNVLTGVAVTPTKRVATFIVFAIAMLLSAVLNNGGNSLLSLFLLMGIYSTFVCPIQLDEPAYKRYFKILADVASIVCILGALAYLLQYAFKADWLFSWRSIVPKQFLIEFNTLNMIRWPQEIYKANGFFLMEASYQSQLAAKALLISIFILRDPKYLIPLGIGLLTAYSGTGIILFLVFGLVPMVHFFLKSKKLRVLVPIGLLLLPVAAIMLAPKLGLHVFVDRLSEFNDPRSSGYARFVGGQLMLDTFLKGDLGSFLFGLGPGAADEFGQSMNFVGEATTLTWIKLLLEYGVFGFCSFLVFFYVCAHHTLRSHWLAAASTFHFFILDSGFASTQQAFMTLILTAYVCLKPQVEKQAAPAVAAKPVARPAPA